MPNPVSFMKVLIIEDDPANLLGISRLVQASWKLDSVTLEIVGVATLADGLKESADANVTILDLGLPDAEIIEVIQSISKFPPPVIVITGHDSPEVTASCMLHGAAHVFVKGALLGFIPSIFEAMQKDIIRRITERA